MPEFVLPLTENVAGILLTGKGIIVLVSGDVLRSDPMEMAAGAADPVIRLGVGEARPEGEFVVAGEQDEGEDPVSMCESAEVFAGVGEGEFVV